ncbi:hypothetical protein [Nocardia aurantiaca]|uniref:Uncharacterized protein n=1 Tax=Nocardia aurantiaca TaxID=2675850 RepID=A0A6I3KUE6_9NOCA|nr:hypothetical protein [Nocardia aurantiaca]MTE13592.1 hypothetical protein [Nocardia aurantiaca]
MTVCGESGGFWRHEMRALAACVIAASTAVAGMWITVPFAVQLIYDNDFRGVVPLLRVEVCILLATATTSFVTHRRPAGPAGHCRHHDRRGDRDRGVRQRPASPRAPTDMGAWPPNSVSRLGSRAHRTARGPHAASPGAREPRLSPGGS